MPDNQPPTNNTSLRRLGKHPVRRDSRTLKLVDYITPTLTPPTEAFYHRKVSGWPMFLNDSLGDCVPAAAGHMIQQWTAYGLGAEYTPTDSQILSAYESIGGYTPTDPATDQGCDMLTALNTWRQTGIAGHRIAAYVSLNPKSWDELRLAIYLFGNVYLGIQLPIAAQNQEKWEIIGDESSPDQVPGSWGGHCIPLIGYNPLLYMCVTWGAELNMTTGYPTAYADEAYAVLTHDWIRKQGTAPSGFNLNQLTADMKSINGEGIWPEWKKL